MLRLFRFLKVAWILPISGESLDHVPYIEPLPAIEKVQYDPCDIDMVACAYNDGEYAIARAHSLGQRIVYLVIITLDFGQFF